MSYIVDPISDGAFGGTVEQWGAVSWLEEQPIVAKVERSGWVSGSVDIHVNNAWDALKKSEKELLVNNWAQTWKAAGGKALFVYDSEGKQVASLSVLHRGIVRD